MAFLLFLLKSSLCSGILLGYYALFLRNKHLHRFNRFYLLATVLVSVILPLLHFEWPHTSLPSYSDQVFKLLDVTDGGTGEEIIPSDGSNRISLATILVGAYAAVSLALLLFTVSGVVRVLKLKQHYPATRTEDYMLIRTSLAEAPFSFFHFLFWREDIDMQSVSGKQILQHELIHIRQKHT